MNRDQLWGASGTVVAVALNVHTGIPVTQFLQCVAFGDMGLAVRWPRLSVRSSAEINVLSALLFPRCSVCMLFCPTSRHQVCKEVAMWPSSNLRLSSPPLVHPPHYLFILCSITEAQSGQTASTSSVWDLGF